MRTFIRTKNIAILVVITVVAASGCVSKGDYEALQKDRDATKAALQQTQQALTQAQARGDDEAAQLKKLTDARDQLQKDLSARQADLEAQQAELAGVMKDKAKLKSSVEDMKQAMADLAKRKAQADQRISEFKSLVDRFKKLIDAGKLRVKIVEGRMVVELATDILFDSGSARLSKDGKASIEEVAAVLGGIENRRFQVEGHTDNVPMHTAQYPSNWELAAARAVNVVKAMVSAGMPPERISAASYAEFKPAQPNDTPEGKASNRRIEIVVVPDLSSLPGFEELQKASVGT